MKNCRTDVIPIALVNLEGVLMDYDYALQGLMEGFRSPRESPWKLSRSGQSDDLHRHLNTRIWAIRRTPGFWKTMRLQADGWWILSQLLRLGFEVALFSEEMIARL